MQKPRYQFTELDQLLLASIRANEETRPTTLADDLKSRIYGSRRFSFEKPLVPMIGWEWEAHTRLSGKTEETRYQEMLEIIRKSPFAQEVWDIECTNISGKPHPSRFYFELTSHPTQITDAIDLYFDIEHYLATHGVPTHRISNHLHFCVLQNISGNKWHNYFSIPAISYHASLGALIMMDKCLPLLATRMQMEGHGDTWMNRMELGRVATMSLEECKCCTITQAYPREYGDKVALYNNNPHTEMRRTMPGTVEEIGLGFHPLIAACAVLAAGINYGLRTSMPALQSEVKRIDPHWIHHREPGYFGKRVARMLHSRTAQRYLGSDLVHALVDDITQRHPVEIPPPPTQMHQWVDYISQRADQGKFWLGNLVTRATHWR